MTQELENERGCYIIIVGRIERTTTEDTLLAPKRSYQKGDNFELWDTLSLLFN